MIAFPYLRRIKKAYILIAVWAATTVIVSLSLTNTVLLIFETANLPNALKLEEETQELTVLKSKKLASSIELFGETVKSSQILNQVNSPETSLNLELQGIFIAEDPRESTAIIGENQKKGKLFLVGDNIFSKGKIIAISEGYVLINRNGRRERIVFSDQKFRTTGVNSVLPGSESTKTGIKDLAKIANAIPPSIRKKTTRERAAKNPTNQINMKERFMNTPSEALYELGVTKIGNGDEKGFKVDRNADKRILQAGLQVGDRILSINGQTLDNGLSEKDIARQAMSAGRLRVEVARGERKFFLTVPVPGNSD